MKKIVYLLLFLTTTISFAQNWQKNIDDAKKIAQENNQKIILVFSGSDWCAPCIKMEKEIWSTAAFKEYATAHYVLLKADFPKRKKNALSKEQQAHNNNLAAKYNTNGYFPLVVILDANGKQLGETGYKKVSPEAFIKIIETY